MYLLVSQSLAKRMAFHEELRPIGKSYGHQNTVGYLASKEEEEHGGQLGHAQCMPRP